MSVNVPKWAGIGAVRYIPDYLLEKLDDIVKYQKEASLGENNLKDDTNAKNGTDEQDSNSTQKSSDETPTQPMQDLQSEKKNSHIKNELIEKYIDEIKSINNGLVEKLQAQDGAFSLGEASDNMVAVKFGMVNEIEDLKKLACQVQDVGKEVEESTRVKFVFVFTIRLII